MTAALPKDLEICFTKEQIASRVTALGKEILPWVQAAESRSGQPILAVCVLRGAVFFFTDLLRALPTSIEPAFCCTWGYSGDAEQAAEVRVSSSELEVRGRAVLILDDICDSGATLRKLQDFFVEQGALDVKTVVVICRQILDQKHDPSWVAFRYPGQEWFVGYGMDMGEKYRNLPEIYRVMK